MNKREFLKMLGVSFAASGTTAAWSQLTSPLASVPGHDVSLDTVLNRGELRAAYIVAGSEMRKDMTTGQLSGICYDLAEALARKIGIKINWVEEVTFGNFQEGLGTRYDALCFSLYRNARQARVADYTRPIFFSPTGVFVRADDMRFSDNLAAINRPDVTIATLDGEQSSIFAQECFPHARTLSLPQGGDIGQMLTCVTSGKADVAMVNAVIAHYFQSSHSGQLKNIAEKNPLAVFGHGFAVAKNAHGLRLLLDVALDEIQGANIVDSVLTAHEPYPHAFTRAATAYA